MNTRTTTERFITESKGLSDAQKQELLRNAQDGPQDEAAMAALYQKAITMAGATRGGWQTKQQPITHTR